MAEYNPRNSNPKSGDEPKATGRWFDKLVERKRDSRGSCGFQIPEGEG